MFAKGWFSPSDYKQAQKAVKITKNLWGKPDGSINKAPKRNRTEKHKAKGPNLNTELFRSDSQRDDDKNA